MFAVVADAASNITPALLDRYDISVIPFTYMCEGKEYLSTPSLFDGPAYYNGIRQGKVFTTSQVTPQRFIDHFTPLLQEGKDIIFISLSSGVSGSFQSAQMAASELKDAFPDRSIALIDSLGAGFGETILAIQAAELREAGKSFEETVAAVRATVPRLVQVFTVDDLKHLSRTGRLSNAGAILGTVLHIKPLLKGNEDGKIVSFAKVRGRAKAIDALVDQYAKYVENAEDQIVFISHGDCPAEALRLANHIKEKKAPREVVIACHEPATGAHVGPGMMGLFFIGSENFRTDK